MNFSEFSEALIQLLVLQDQFGRQMFDALLPRIISDAEGRIFHDPELDFPWMGTVNDQGLTQVGMRSVPIPAALVVLENVNLIVPAGTFPTPRDTSPAGKRIALLRVDRAFIDATWPDESLTETPKRFETYYAPYSQDSADPEASPSAIKIAPTPDGAYHVEYIGTFIPAPISTANPSTELSTRYPELLLAGAMVFGCALLKNWSAMADDPKSAVSWEMHFQAVKEVVKGEVGRQNSQGPGWTSTSQPGMANRPRFSQPPPVQG